MLKGKDRANALKEVTDLKERTEVQRGQINDARHKL